MTPADRRHLRRALELAGRGLGETNPNPLVGCVIVRGREVVGEGFHGRAGGPHAEVVALRRAGARAAGATLYVNLEPCAHQGRTPPCAPLVAQSGVRRVVVALRDPNPLVSGRGLARLRRSGVEVEVAAGELAAAARAQNERFLEAARLDRPFVLLKAAITLDGRIATASGDSRWITSNAQRREARRLRRLHDGVAVGIGTALQDDPLLLPEPRTRRPFHRVVFDSRCRLPLRARLVASLADGPLWVVARPPLDAASAARRRDLEAAGVRVIEAEDLAQALVELRRQRLWSLMVEGGGQVLGSFLAAGLFERVALFRAPLLLGGQGSRPAFGGPDPERISEARRLRLVAPPPSPHYELWRP